MLHCNGVSATVWEPFSSGRLSYTAASRFHSFTPVNSSRLERWNFCEPCLDPLWKILQKSLTDRACYMWWYINFLSIFNAIIDPFLYLWLSWSVKFCRAIMSVSDWVPLCCDAVGLVKETDCMIRANHDCVKTKASNSTYVVEITINYFLVVCF